MTTPVARFPFQYAPYQTSNIVSGDDYKTTAQATFPNISASTTKKLSNASDYQRRLNMSKTSKLDPPFRLWLSEKESQRKDYIKERFENRSTGLVRPRSHTITQADREKHKEESQIKVKLAAQRVASARRAASKY